MNKHNQAGEPPGAGDDSPQVTARAPRKRALQNRKQIHQPAG